MKKIVILILWTLILSNIVSAKVEHFYEINLEYYNGNLSYSSVQIKPMDSENKLKNIQGGYIAEVLSNEDEVLNLTFFDIPLVLVYDNMDEKGEEITGGGLINLNETEIIIKVPYYENAKEINIYDKNITKKLTINVENFSKAALIKKEENTTESEEILPKEKIQVEEKRLSTNYLTYIVFIILIVLIGIFLIKKLRKTDY